MDDGHQESAGDPRGQWPSLPRQEQRRLLAGALLRAALAAIGLVGAYYVIPFGPEDDTSIVVQAVIAGALVLLVLAMQIWGVAKADYPLLRAFEGLALAVPLVILLFAATYLTLSVSDAASFTEELDHTGALYFAITTSATVGFGDIAARSDGARIAVMVQMVATVAVLGVVAKAMLGSARRRSSPGHD